MHVNIRVWLEWVCWLMTTLSVKYLSVCTCLTTIQYNTITSVPVTVRGFSDICVCFSPLHFSSITRLCIDQDLSIYRSIEFVWQWLIQTKIMLSASPHSPAVVIIIIIMDHFCIALFFIKYELGLRFTYSRSSHWDDDNYAIDLYEYSAVTHSMLL